MEHYTPGELAGVTPRRPPGAAEVVDEVVAQIKDLLETRIRPAGPGRGDIVFQDS